MAIGAQQDAFADLVVDALLVSVSLVGFYAVIIDIPQGYG